MPKKLHDGRAATGHFPISLVVPTPSIKIVRVEYVVPISVPISGESYHPTVRTHTGSHLQVIQEFRRRRDSRYHQVVPRTSTGYIKQVSLRVVDLLEIRIIRDGFDSLL